MELGEQGKIGTLIVKDQSRLGRNRLVVGQLLEEEFDRLGIRYIAIMDNIDTAKGISDLVPMQDLFNEWHAKNTSQKYGTCLKTKVCPAHRRPLTLPMGTRKTSRHFGTVSCAFCNRFNRERACHRSPGSLRPSGRTSCCGYPTSLQAGCRQRSEDLRSDRLGYGRSEAAPANPPHWRSPP